MQQAGGVVPWNDEMDVKVNLTVEKEGSGVGTGAALTSLQIHI
jgi:hypothetical protein